MSVLIKGMEMPKYCIECKFCGSGSINEFEFWCGLTGSRLGAIGDIVLWEDMCAEDCPLVDVPTPHGPLKDVDELKEWIEAWFTMHRNYHPYSKSNLIPSTELIDIIDRLPTIIEAEGEAEE